MSSMWVKNKCKRMLPELKCKLSILHHNCCHRHQLSFLPIDPKTYHFHMTFSSTTFTNYIPWDWAVHLNVFGTSTSPTFLSSFGLCLSYVHHLRMCFPFMHNQSMLSGILSTNSRLFIKQLRYHIVISKVLCHSHINWSHEMIIFHPDTFHPSFILYLRAFHLSPNITFICICIHLINWLIWWSICHCHPSEYPSIILHMAIVMLWSKLQALWAD